MQLSSSSAQKAPTTIKLKQIIGRVRGGSRACRAIGEDDRNYIVKLEGNPQGNCSLIAEVLGTHVLSAMGLPVPRIQLAKFADPSVVEKLEEVGQWTADQTHLAIAYPTDPDRNSIYDLLPEPSWKLVANRECFWGALVADKCVANLDCRQAIFVRRRNLDLSAVNNSDPGNGSTGFEAILIDQGLCFNGRAQDFKVAAGHGLYLKLAGVQRTH